MNQKGIITAYKKYKSLKKYMHFCKKSPNPKLKMKLKKKKLLGLGTCKSNNKLLKKMSEADFVLGQKLFWTLLPNPKNKENRNICIIP